MNYLQQSGRITVSVVLFFILAPLALMTQAASLELSRSQLRLDNARIENQVQLNIQTQHPEKFSINISAVNATASPDEFILKPELPDASGKVVVVMDLPYRDQGTNGLQSRASINRVRNNQPRTASNEFSLCNETKKVCKPLTVLVKDDDTAIPGIIYSSVITLQVTDDQGQSRQQRLILKYHKDGDRLGIKKSKKRLNLNSTNDYTDSVDLCVFSPVYNHFWISFEDKKRHQFVLKGKKTRELLPYNVSFSRKENPNSSIAVSPKQWSFGGHPAPARKRSMCSENNIRVFVDIDRKDVNRSPADTYKGKLVIRVKAL